ncbi:MAG: L-threonylcarbamoyladenylate synthase [Lachnospiraceae bacterium]
MKTIIKKLDEKVIDKSVIEEAGAIIRAGGLVAFPTETVYGLGADALQPKASEKIYAAKGRPSDNPLIVHIADFKDLNKIVREVPGRARILAERFWPGPLTMILNKSERVPLETTGGLETVGIRMPNNNIALELIRAGGGYIAAPSANTSGKPSPTIASHVEEDLNGKIPLILDGGPVGIGIESTIVDLTLDAPQILRPGYVTPQMLEEALGEVVIIDPAISGQEVKGRPKAPGMKYKHYAPKADLIIVQGTREAVTDRINRLCMDNKEQGITAGVICTKETEQRYKHGVIKSIGSREDEETIARHLFGILREFDKEEVSVIYTESFESEGLGQAVMNRLVKAAGHHFLEV